MKRVGMLFLAAGLVSCAVSEVPGLPPGVLNSQSPASPSPAPSQSLTTPSPSPATPSPEPSPSSRSSKVETLEALAAPSIPFKYVAIGDWKNDSIANGHFVVLDQLSDIHKIMRTPESLPHSEARNLLKLDFSKERAIFVCDKMYPCVESTEIVAIEDTPEALVVHSITWDPLSGGCLTAVSQPFSIVAIPKGNKPIKFKPIIFDDEHVRPTSKPWPTPL